MGEVSGPDPATYSYLSQRTLSMLMRRVSLSDDHARLPFQSWC